MKKIILLIIVTCLLFVGCSLNNSETNRSADILLTDIVGENNLGKDELVNFLNDKFIDILISYENKYNEEVVNIKFDNSYIVDKKQEEVDMVVLNTACTIMKISKYISENYNYDGSCRINYELKINDGTINYYTNASDLNYLEGDSNYDLLKSYMMKVIILVTGKTDIRDSIINSFKEQFNIHPEHI